MATYLPVAQHNAMLAGGFPAATEFYWGFNTASPGQTGANEVTETRQESEVTTATAGKSHTASAMTWTDMAATTIDYFSIWTALTSGTYKGGGPTTASITVPAGSTVSAAIGAFTLEQTG